MKRLALALLVIAPVAYAQSPELTKEFQAGIDAFRLGKFDEAREHLEKARDMDPKLPGPYRFLAAVAQAQARWPECIDNARKALELNPRSAEVMDTRKLVETCRVSAGRLAYRGDLGDSAAIAVTTSAAGATVKINGLTYGATPIAPRPIAPGPLDVEIEKPGWKPAKTSVNAIPGVVTDVIVDLEALPGGGATSELKTDAKDRFKTGYLVVPAGTQELLVDGQARTEKDRIELSPGTHTVEVREPGKDPWRRRIRIGAGQKTLIQPELFETGSREQDERLGFYVLGAGSGMLALGFVACLISRDAANEARDIVRVERSRDISRPLSETETIAPIRTRDDLQKARDKAARWSTISNGAYAAGLITGAIGAYFLYKGGGERTDVPPPFAVSPVAGGAVISKELAW